MLHRWTCPKGHIVEWNNTIAYENDANIFCNNCGTLYKGNQGSYDSSGATQRVQSRDPLLVEREKIHGTFSDNARIWDRFTKSINTDHHMKPEQRLALYMIFLKIARMTQNPSVKDHWDDIAGYAKLGSEACES